METTKNPDTSTLNSRKKSSGREWTKEQLSAITARGNKEDGGTLLVSAAAGSGKTSVLVERIAGIITDKNNPVDVEKLLVVTFTKAAAAEMKQRLSKTLAGLLKQNPSDFRLQRQQILLPFAQISTVHSFCANLVKENFQNLGLSPQLKVGDTGETELLMAEALEEAVEEKYRLSINEEGELDKKGDFYRLTVMFGGDKNNDSLLQVIKNLYHFVQSHPFPESWFEEKLALYDFEAQPPLLESPVGRVVFQHIAESLSYIIMLYDNMIELSSEDDNITVKVTPFLQSEKEKVEKTAEIFLSTKNNWDEKFYSLAQFKTLFGRLSFPKKDIDTYVRDRIKKLRDIVKETVKGFEAVMCGDEKSYLQNLKEGYPVVKELFDTVMLFSKLYDEKKRAENILDYNDLEHFSLKLLLEETEAEHGRAYQKTPLAEVLSEQYEMILVDEYQDTNYTQDALFKALSKDEKNLFFVGDVKQSIYAFRNAMPSIFISRREKYPEYNSETPQFPATITLGSNFRSRQTVTDTVNFIFYQIMRKELGGIDYDEKEELINGAKFDEGEGYETELILIDDDERDEESYKVDVEARQIARRIDAMVDNLDIKEGDSCRKATYGDFCILLRSKKGVDRAYVKELMRNGIPAWTLSDSGFFETTEISVALSILRVIDNPIQDVPLLSALMSPLFGFSPDDMAEIRLLDRSLNLYSAVRRYQIQGTDENLKSKIQKAFSLFDSWRTVAVSQTADVLINRVYEDLGMLSVYSVINGGSSQKGKQREANLRLLHEKARGFEQNGFRGLASFIRYINNLQKQGKDFAPASVSGQVDAVSVVSIHSSKGLEYPVVFVAGLGKNFNKQEFSAKFLYNSELGVGFKNMDIDGLLKWNTLSLNAIKLIGEKNLLAEELRVLYVAMTRAKEKLCLVMSVDGVEKTLSAMAAKLPSNDDKLPVGLIRSASGLKDWVLLTALRHPSCQTIRELAGIDESYCRQGIKGAETSWKVTVTSEAVELSTEESLAELLVEARLDDQPSLDEKSELAIERYHDIKNFKEIIEARTAFKYPFEKVLKLPRKLAASQYFDYFSAEIKPRYVASSRPAFLSEGGLTPAERGTALHSFMQFADYNRAKNNLDDEMARMVENGFLSFEQVKSIDAKKLNTFFEGSLYRRIENAATLKGNVLREFGFTIDIPIEEVLNGSENPSDLFNNFDDIRDSVVVQGIADCVLIEDGMFTIIDYKTDAIKSELELTELYKPQMSIYKRALTLALDIPFKECLLYSFAMGKEVAVNL